MMRFASSVAVSVDWKYSLRPWCLLPCSVSTRCWSLSVTLFLPQFADYSPSGSKLNNVRIIIQTPPAPPPPPHPSLPQKQPANQPNSNNNNNHQTQPNTTKHNQTQPNTTKHNQTQQRNKQTDKQTNKQPSHQPEHPLVFISIFFWVHTGGGAQDLMASRAHHDPQTARGVPCFDGTFSEDHPTRDALTSSGCRKGSTSAKKRLWFVSRLASRKRFGTAARQSILSSSSSRTIPLSRGGRDVSVPQAFRTEAPLRCHVA